MSKASVTAGAVLAGDGEPVGSGRPSELRRILVGFDERPASRDALTLAAALAERAGAELVVAAVRAYWPELIGASSYARVLAEDEAWLRREARKALGEGELSTRVIAGDHQTGGLKEVAVAEDADLIVIGSTHRGRVGQVQPGGVGKRVLKNAPCAVALAPLGLAETEFELERIAVGYDGSVQSDMALRLAGSLAANGGAPLRILGAVEAEPSDPAHGSVESREEARMRRALDKARRSLGDSVAVETRLVRRPANLVLAEATADLDLLVVGSRGHYGHVRRVFLGSLGAQITRTAACPVLVTPA
jgi:nucleotide-binding universal stress UspA family protein